MSTPTRFELSPEDLHPPELPPLQTSSIDETLQQLSEDICRYDPDLAEIVFSMGFSKQSKEQKLSKIRDWAKV